jgi:ribonuclease Z
MSLKLTVIGCSAGIPSAHVSTSSYLLESENTTYLFDAGDGTASAALRLGIDVNSIDKVFITHMHSDHSMGLPLLVQLMKGLKRTRPLHIYLPREAEDGFKRLFYMIYLFPEKLGFDINFVGVERGFEFNQHNIRIDFFQNSHLFANKQYIISRTIPNRLQSFSMEVKTDGKKFVYSGDIGAIGDLEQIIENADLLLTEGMHLEMDELPLLLQEKNVKKLLLTHLYGQGTEDEIRVMFEKEGYSEIEFAREGLVIEI